MTTLQVLSLSSNYSEAEGFIFRSGAILEMLLFVLVLHRLPVLPTDLDLVELVHQSVLDYRTPMDTEARAIGKE